MKHYGKMQELIWKLKTNFKTQVDDESDAYIRACIQRRFPDHSIYSEETLAKEQESEWSWIVDPLDGTLPYTYGINDHFSVCIALAHHKQPVVGVISAPLRKELYVAEQGIGAYCNGEKISVSLEEEVNKVLIDFGGGKETNSFRRVTVAPYLAKLLSATGVCCTFSSGCASVPLALVASGKLHACGYLSLEPWDMAAAVVINREAGARVTTIEGREWDIHEPSILTANPRLHSKLCTLLYS